MARYPSEHKVRTRKSILAAADRVMKANGVGAASVAAVMREAGLTVGGFYAHFPSKEALAQEALLHGVEASVERMLALLAPITDRGTMGARIDPPIPGASRRSCAGACMSIDAAAARRCARRARCCATPSPNAPARCSTASRPTFPRCPQCRAGKRRWPSTRAASGPSSSRARSRRRKRGSASCARRSRCCCARCRWMNEVC